jgi:hypothetical protein
MNVFLNGYWKGWRSLSSVLKKSVVYSDVETSPYLLIRTSNVLVIPTGGLMGMETLKMFKAILSEFVSRGGVIVCFTQQHGYEWSVLPNGEQLTGFGWREDASCTGPNSAYIDTYHPIFSSQTKGWLTANWDGYFTSYPDSTIVLARRNKNAQACMLMYPYGKGWVIATTMYSDWGYAHSQTGTNELNIIRDILTWSQKGKVDGEYKPGDEVNIPVKIINK